MIINFLIIIQVRSNYREWINRRFADIEAVENEDFDSVEISTVVGGTQKKEHIIKLDTAKEMAMLERNEKGKQVRRHFIKVEKKYRAGATRPRTALEQLMLQNQAILEVNEKVDDVKQDLEDFKNDMPILGVEESRITEAVRKKGVKCLGGKNSNAYKDKSLRGKVYQDIYRELKRQFGVATYKAIKRNQCETAVHIIEVYELPIVLAEQITDCNAQTNMEVA